MFVILRELVSKIALTIIRVLIARVVKARVSRRERKRGEKEAFKGRSIAKMYEESYELKDKCMTLKFIDKILLGIGRWSQCCTLFYALVHDCWD